MSEFRTLETGVWRTSRLLSNLARRLRDEHPGAAASLDEGLDEALTVKRFGLPSKLEGQFSTTNAIVNLMGAVRGLTQRVKRWRGGSMILRWTATAFADAASRIRRVTGARAGMTTLVHALEGHENNQAVATRARAA